jgi:hypothetical protein
MKHGSTSLKPWVRALKYSFLKKSAEYKAQKRILKKQTISSRNVAFIIGCGRSGTTILGQLFSLHNNVNYFFEPYHLWSVIDPMTDVLNLYHRIDAKFMMDEADATEEAKLRFNRVFFSDFMNSKEKLILEKTPLNTMRLGYLNSLTPQAKFIHIIRNGVDVSCSIERIALTNSYKIAGKPKLNQWWGVENYKWKALSRDGALASYYPEEVGLCENHRSKGAYEWLVSLGEVDCWREQLGDRLYEITYDQLTANPEDTLRNICKFLELDSAKLWLNQATNMISPTPPTLRETLSLPPRMCDAFNRYQKRFGFANRAIPLEGSCC